MQTNLLWTGREYHSIENCLISIEPTGADVSSTIVGYYQEKIYKVEYRIKTDQHWQTMLLEINARYSNKTQLLRLEGDGKGNWLYNANPAPELTGCLDVDIPLTPFTNTLPIRRLNFRQHQSQEIAVIYCDVLGGQVSQVRQKYTRLSSTQFHYENVPNDFEATILVDEAGLVVDYPLLFVRTASMETKN
jgi:uncharacterized protein